MAIGNAPDASKDIKSEIIRRAFENNSGARELKEKLLNILNNSHFDINQITSLIKEWNDETMATKGFNGPFTNVDGFQSEHGRLNLNHYLTSDSIKFEFTPEAVKN